MTTEQETKIGKLLLHTDDAAFSLPMTLRNPGFAVGELRIGEAQTIVCAARVEHDWDERLETPWGGLGWLIWQGDYPPEEKHENAERLKRALRQLGDDAGELDTTEIDGFPGLWVIWAIPHAHA